VVSFTFIVDLPTTIEYEYLTINNILISMFALLEKTENADAELNDND
jgi:hypothetical protein